MAGESGNIGLPYGCADNMTTGRVTHEKAELGFGERFAGRLLAAAGWKVVFVSPPGPKSVIIFYPHTSNWDFVVGILARARLRLRCHFLGKDTLFRGPLGRWLRHVGGIPTNRRNPTGMIGDLVDEFSRREEFHLVIAPEGTRSKTDHWKSGFYRLALAAGVPLGLAFIDYGRREIGIGDWLVLTGDEETDLGRMRAFYADKTGRHPEKHGVIRFVPQESRRS